MPHQRSNSPAPAEPPPPAGAAPSEVADLADLPSPPAAIAKVVRLASDPDVSTEKLGAAIASDPAFTAELLRTVNSPFYGLTQPVTAASRAVTVLGIRALRNLAICFAVRDSLRTSGFRAQDLESFWEDCLRRAAAARALARVTGLVAPDTAFTLGLLQDFGMLALLRGARKDLHDWPAWQGLLPDERLDVERARYGLGHDQIFERLGERWGLPRSLVDALAHHHAPDAPDVPEDVRPLARVARAADLVAALVAGRKNAALAAVRTTLEQDFAIDATGVDALLEPLAREVEQAATALGMRVQRQPTYEAILAEANRTLVAMNLSYEELLTKLERALAEKEALARQLEEANARLAQLAYQDPLTGLSNRRHFDVTFREMLIQAASAQHPVSLIIVDLDHFKVVNDTHGHGVGDAVLVATAGVLASACGPRDIKARLGGEELALVLGNGDDAAAVAVAEQLRLEVSRLAVPCRSGFVRITASFGVATFRGSGSVANPERLARTLTELADKALYRSKNGGRNRVTLGGLVG